ncbi:MAG: hypothetical protein A3J93_00300 [Candidatus Magasanikbacteria bacterium RIFOXYC2_FULL_42_28]|uniref:Uncharacterized protein n=1 Tax=Candidatus Magasanikbacteria bacterium RIFOXYC2_FULL_42_28 TaxID=1798704 RepID=A0A1F6NW67_9BACT|nr:MAG: hypothetical protein A3J93_00300 [Candidatus Magasanikbacteria bacterium RIFOXYC2_FULL_42_28]
MRIDQGQFLQVGERAGVKNHDIAKILADIEGETGEKVKPEVARAILRMLSGKELKGDDAKTLLREINAELYDVGVRSASQNPDQNAEVSWTKDKRDSVKILVAALEGCLFDGQILNIKPEHYSLFAFLVNRLAKIGETQVRAGGELLVADYNKEKLESFVRDVEQFAQQFLTPDNLETEEQNCKINIEENNRQSYALAETVKNKELQARQKDDANPQLTKQRKKTEESRRYFYDYKNDNERALHNELGEIINEIIERLEQMKEEYTPAREELGRDTRHNYKSAVQTMLATLIKKRKDIIDKIINNIAGGEWNKFSLGTVLEDDHFALEGEERGTHHALSVLLWELERRHQAATSKAVQPKKMATPKAVPKTTPKIQGKGFGALAQLKDALPDNPTKKPQEKSLLSLLSEDLPEGTHMQTLLRLRDNLIADKRHGEAMATKVDTEQERKQRYQLETERRVLSIQLGSIERLKQASPQLIIDSGSRIRASIKTNPGSGLYLLKSMIVALKVMLDEYNLQDNQKPSASIAIDLALKKRPSNGQKTGQIFMGPRGGFDSRNPAGNNYETVHFPPEHLPFALAAVAYALKQKDAE